MPLGAVADSEKLVELASGIDALYLSGRCELATDLVRSLEAGRESAAGTEGVPFSLGGEEFRLAGYAFGKHRYRLEHVNGLLGLTVSRALPTVRVQPRAELLHSVGPVAALAWFDRVIRWECDDVYWSVSRVDLFSDWQGWTLTPDDRGRFVCRATRRDTHEDGERLTGFEFGRRKGKTVCARIYDKTLQVEQKGLDWWPQVWGSGFDPERQVVRVEFELGRVALRDFDLDAPADVLDAAGSLWASLSTDWLTHRDRGADRTRSRWAISEEWRSIQHPTMRSDAIGLDRMAAGRRRGSLRKLMPGLNGYLASFAAHVGTDDIADTLAVLPPHLRDYQVLSRRSFSERVAEKRAVTL